jgi:hypothetical protein
MASEEPWNNAFEFQTLLTTANNKSLLFNSTDEMNQLIHVFGNYSNIVTIYSHNSNYKLFYLLRCFK